MNSSPACDYSTPITKRYVEDGLEDIIKVIVDYREYSEHRNKYDGKSSEKQPPSTGKWELVLKGDYIPVPVSSFGTDFHVKGHKILKRRHSVGGGIPSREVKLPASVEEIANATENQKPQTRVPCVSSMSDMGKAMDDTPDDNAESDDDPDPLL